MKKLSSKIAQLKEYVIRHQMSEQIALLFDVSQLSHIPRLRVVDIPSQRVVMECLAASGRGRSIWSRLFPRTGDMPESWLTPVGHCLIAERYNGEFGVAYRLDGLDETNANMRSRSIVIHSSPEVPNAGFSLLPLWCSRGCVVVSPSAFKKIDALLKERLNVLLWIYKD